MKYTLREQGNSPGRQPGNAYGMGSFACVFPLPNTAIHCKLLVGTSGTMWPCRAQYQCVGRCQNGGNACLKVTCFYQQWDGNQGPADGAAANTNQPSSPLKVTVKIIKDPLLDYGFMVSEDSPVCVKSVTAGGPGEGKLFPGDQILQINDMPLDTISQERIDNIMRECGNTVTVTVLRNTPGPKSSFITEEKRARLKSNPVKVHFAEEVIVNGQVQGNSLLLMPGILKVYLENGQTKAFQFEKNTTVKDIILSLKSKLSIRCIEHFALVLKERYTINKIYILHDDELIEQVVQKREPRDYRCLFRVCFLPRDPLVLLQDDPVTFEYLYSQSCNDVLLERFAMEMKYSTAIHLAALQIQECILSSNHSEKVSMKYIEMNWGIENFVSSTVLDNMKEKDIRKAINYHLKNNHSLIAPGQKQLISTAQVRLNYLNILSDLRAYGGKTFNATLLLQDSESFITLLVGAKYGISEVVNSKLNIINQLTDFNNIQKLELTFEYEKISVVNIYLVDVKSLTLVLETRHAKDLVCLIAGYHRLYVNSTDSIFIWPGNYQSQTTEEGDEAQRLSDSESSSDIESIDIHKLRNGFIGPLTEENEDIENSESEATDSDCLRENIQEETSCSTGDVSDLNDEATCQGGHFCDRSCSADSMDELQTETSAPHSHGEISEDDDKDSNTEESDGEPVTKKHCTMELKDSFEQPSADSLASTSTLSKCFACFTKVVCSIPDLSQSENPCTAEVCNQCPRNEDDSYAEGDKSWNLTSHGLLTELPPAIDGDLYSEVLTIPILAPPPDEFFDAAEKVTHVEGSGDIKFSGTEAELESAKIKGIEAKQNVQISPSLFGTGLDIKSVECIKEDLTALTENSVLEEEISSRRNSSKTDKKSKDAYSLDISRLRLNLNRVSFKTFGMFKHLKSPHLEPKIETCAVRSLNISECNTEPAEDSSKDDLSKTEQISNQTEASITEISTSIICPQDRNLPQEISSLTNTPRQLYEVDNSTIQESATATQQNECPSTKLSCLQQIKNKHSLNVDSRVQAILTTDLDKEIDEQLPISDKDTCSCKIVHGNRFRAQGTDVNDESKDLAYSIRQCSPKTTPPDSENHLSQYLTTFTGQSEKFMLTSCSFDFPKTDLTPKLEGSILSQFKAERYSMPNGFHLIRNNIMELLNVLKEFPRESHIEEECAILTSSIKEKLYIESGKLMSAGQKGIKVDQAPVEMLLGVSESFQALIQLTATCLQFTTCMHCAERHAKVVNNLKDVSLTYKTFVKISQDACSRKCDDLRMKLLAQQCNALTADVFCLTQSFK
ncbi:FERM and PDZ domain-containing protein 1-like [Hemiscyllium ocellatum]|uniref:FERM and PDZ domain-containing protein 1-like n=1 Tax=Hemiscyllium ocellatum TaxID=170820 RepID=UPI002966BB52|nr:FERM and PDZ domain-containing protein 1-like [Hemiscyllium ocellatum]